MLSKYLFFDQGFVCRSTKDILPNANCASDLFLANLLLFLALPTDYGPSTAALEY